jgi:hypothetical protein
MQAPSPWPGLACRESFGVCSYRLSTRRRPRCSVFSPGQEQERRLEQAVFFVVATTVHPIIKTVTKAVESTVRDRS